MVVVQASKLSLPNPSLSSPHVTSLLFEPSSLSLALMHSDSSFSLYPCLSPLHLSSLPPPQTLVPAPSSSSTFLLVQNPNPSNTGSDSRVLFVVSGPHGGGSRILLRFYVLQVQKKVFARAQVVCNQKDLQSDRRLGVLVDSLHGVSIKLTGSVNFMAMHSASSSKVWVFAVRLLGDDSVDDRGDVVVVKLMRCAVIECSKPLFSISLSFGLLILGEENGVRAFNLRQLLKGRDSKAKNSQSNLKPDGRKLRLPNGVIGADMRSDRCGKCDVLEGSSDLTCLDGKKQMHLGSEKQRSIRLRQDSCELGACFAAFSGKNIEESKSRVTMSAKAISIQALSLKKFIILDSAGDLHLLCWCNPVIGSDMTPHMRQLPRVMNVQKLAVLADSSTRTQTLWVSDGQHSLHMMVASDMETVVNEKDRTKNEEKLMHISAIRAIFSGEKIEDVIPLAANAILILGQVEVTLDDLWQFDRGSLIAVLFKCFLHVFSGCYGSVCFLLPVHELQFLHRSNCEKAVENTELLEVMESGSVGCLSWSSAFRVQQLRRCSLSPPTTSLLPGESLDLLAVGSSSVFVLV